MKQYKNSIWHLNLDQQIKATAQQIQAAEKDLEPHCIHEDRELATLLHKMESTIHAGWSVLGTYWNSLVPHNQSLFWFISKIF